MICLIILGIVLGFIFAYFVMIVWLRLHCRIWDLEQDVRKLKEKVSDIN